MNDRPLRRARSADESFDAAAQVEQFRRALPRLEHFVLHHWGRSRVEEGDFDAAERCFRESRALRATLRDPLVASSDKALRELATLRTLGRRRTEEPR